MEVGMGRVPEMKKVHVDRIQEVAQRGLDSPRQTFEREHLALDALLSKSEVVLHAVQQAAEAVISETACKSEPHFVIEAGGARVRLHPLQNVLLYALDGLRRVHDAQLRAQKHDEKGGGKVVHALHSTSRRIATTRRLPRRS